MAAAVPTVRGMEAAQVLSSCSEGAAAAIARVRTISRGGQFVGLHSTASKPSSASSTSSSSASSCSSSSCFSSSCCISRQSNHGPSSNRLQLSHSRQQGAPAVINARKRNGRFASRRAPESASKGAKTREESGGSVALKDPESAGTVSGGSSSGNRNLKGGFVALRVPDTAPDLASFSSSSSVNSDLIGGLIALRVPDAATLSAASSSGPNLTFAATAGEVRKALAEDLGEAIEDICTSGTLSATLSSLIRVQEAKLFGPSIFNVSKLRVLLLGKHDDERPLQHPRIYTLTHSDLTAMITLAVAREINMAQVMGWYSKLQRDEVVAEWRRTQGEMSLHVHCHISGTNFLHRLIAKLRFYIFQKELPLVLEAFRQGDRDLFQKHPELLNAPVWVYFHSNVEDYNRVECWGPLVNATKRGVPIQQWGPTEDVSKVAGETEQHFPGAAACLVPCECCSRHETVIPIPESLNRHLQQTHLQQRRSLRKGASQSSSFRLC